MVPNFFYIVKFNGHMYEVKYTPEKIKAVMEAIENKGWIILREEQIQTNSTGIEDVMTPEQYDNWVETQRPKQFVKNGIWYYGKDKSQMRVEKWRAHEIEADKKKSLPPADKPMTPAQKKKVKKIREQISKKFSVKPHG